MANKKQLHIYEELFLLALRDKEGTIFPTVNYRHALAGAMVAELLLKEIVVVESGRWGKFLVLKNPNLTGDELLDECIEKMSKAKRRAQIKTWVQRFSNVSRLKTRVAGQLCRKNILKEREEKVLFIFRHRIYPEVDPRPEKLIINRLEKAIFGSAVAIDPDTLILISVCNAVGLLNKLFDRKRLREKKQRIKQIIEGELAGKATREAIEAMQAAAMVVAMIPVVAASGH